MYLRKDHYYEDEIPDGSLLRCVEVFDERLVRGRIYRVVGRTHGYVNIMDTEGKVTRGWFWSRFELVNMGSNQGDD